jgi:hypothetical protein
MLLRKRERKRMNYKSLTSKARSASRVELTQLNSEIEAHQLAQQRLTSTGIRLLSAASTTESAIVYAGWRGPSAAALRAAAACGTNRMQSNPEQGSGILMAWGLQAKNNAKSRINPVLRQANKISGLSWVAAKSSFVYNGLRGATHGREAIREGLRYWSTASSVARFSRRGGAKTRCVTPFTQIKKPGEGNDQADFDDRRRPVRGC